MQKKIPILVIEDSEDDFFLLQRHFEKSGMPVDFILTDNEKEARQTLLTGEVAAIIADYAVPQFNAIQALHLAHQIDPDLPFIIVSGEIGEETAVAAMRAGAHDYIMKNNLSRLVPALERELKEAETRRLKRQADEKIRQQLKEKDLLLREIHHRVKNNLQVIQSLLTLQSRNFKDPQILNLCKDIKSRIRSMVLVHELLFRTPDLSKINLAQYLQTLIRELFTEFHIDRSRIDYALDLEPVYLNIDETLYLGLIIHEILTNALKHAFDRETVENGLIELLVHHSDNTLYMEAADNGVGLHHKGVPNERETLGLHLISLLVKEQLEGTLEIDMSEGTRYRMSFTFDLN